MSDTKGFPQRPRKATGPERPHYLDNTDIDRVMAIMLALISEVAAIRERLDTHECVASEGLPTTPSNIESHRPSEEVEDAREAWRDAFIRRLFRVVTDDAEALTRATEKSGQ